MTDWKTVDHGRSQVLDYADARFSCKSKASCLPIYVCRKFSLVTFYLGGRTDELTDSLSMLGNRNDESLPQ